MVVDLGDVDALLEQSCLRNLAALIEDGASSFFVLIISIFIVNDGIPFPVQFLIVCLEH